MRVQTQIKMISHRKYGNKKIKFNGMTFDSKREYERYLYLRTLWWAGKIKELKTQVPFELIPAQREPSTVGKRGGTKQGRVIENSVKYIADFVYMDENGKTVVEDVKGLRTKDYKIKRKLMLYIHGVRIKEI